MFMKLDVWTEGKSALAISATSEWNNNCCGSSTHRCCIHSACRGSPSHSHTCT